MTLLAVERIKLFSTRSPWWSMLLALGMTIGFAALRAGATDHAELMDVTGTQLGYQFGIAVIMVLAALTVTTEYRFSTIRTTFLAVPNRTSAVLAKTAVVALVSAVIGLIAAFGSWGISTLIQPTADLSLNSGADWRTVAGVSLVFAIASVIAIAVGTMIRHTAGAIALLLTYALAAENLIRMIPTVGDDIYQWLPFNVANRFLTGNPDPSSGGLAMQIPGESTLAPWWALGYFAAVAATLLTIAIITAKRRDA